MSDSGSGSKDSVTEVAEEESFVRERPPDIERGTVLAGRYQIEDIIGKGGAGSSCASSIGRPRTSSR